MNQDTDNLVIELSTWAQWEALGWTLHTLPDGQMAAIHKVRKMATASAKRVETLIRRLARGEENYFYYVKWTTKRRWKQLRK